MMLSLLSLLNVSMLSFKYLEISSGSRLNLGVSLLTLL